MFLWLVFVCFSFHKHANLLLAQYKLYRDRLIFVHLRSSKGRIIDSVQVGRHWRKTINKLEAARWLDLRECQDELEEEELSRLEQTAPSNTKKET